MMMIIIIQIAWHSSEKRPAGGACAPLFSRFGFGFSLCVCPPVPQSDHPGQCKDTFFVCTGKRGHKRAVVAVQRCIFSSDLINEFIPESCFPAFLKMYRIAGQNKTGEENKNKNNVAGFNKKM